MNNPKTPIESSKIPIFHYTNQIHWKRKKKSTKEKVSGPDPFNYDYIHYSDIQIR